MPTPSTIVVQGYVILQPLSPWDMKHAEAIWGDLSVYGFGKSAGEAWLRMLPTTGNKGEDAIRRQRMMEGGYRLARATMIIQPNVGEDDGNKTDTS